MLEPGQNADLFSDQLARDLLDVVDERSGHPLVTRVLKTRDHYQGEHLNVLPDLLVEWNDRTPIGSTLVGGGAGATIHARSPKVGRVTGTNEFGRTGEHRPEGFFIAAGPSRQSGSVARSISILDFAPTFATFFDARLPQSDGRVSPELLAAWR
jgi:predicted AlkP superfamily phosphohydrolase/phosphomutase